MSEKYNSSINPVFAILGAFLCKIWGSMPWKDYVCYEQIFKRYVHIL